MMEPQPPPQKQQKSDTGSSATATSEAVAGIRQGDDNVNDSPVPPSYDGSLFAVDVFANSYFYENETAAAQARGREPLEKSGLSGQTIANVRHTYLTAPFFEFEPLIQSIGASKDRVKQYLDSADWVSKQKEAGAKLSEKYSCDFETCTIPFKEINAKLLPLVQQEDLGDDIDIGCRTIDLSFWAPLRLPQRKEKFLAPAKIYVRDCMRRIFGLFRDDSIQPEREPNSSYSAALIGSPGVGKSILFFLAALYQATTSKIVYYRLTKDEGFVSMFVMTPDEENKSVRVWFTRNVRKNSLDRLSQLSVDLERSLPIRPEDYYTFLDGPKHDDKNTLDGVFDYFCTSGGMPRYKNEENKKRLWILDAWTEDESLKWIRHLHDQDTAKRAYFLCGGNIRDMLDACDSYETVENQLDRMVKDLTSEAVTLAVETTNLSRNPGNPDRLRTMFELRKPSEEEASKQLMLGYQVVDSQYLLGCLRQKLDVGKFIEAYNLCVNNGALSAAGNFFELSIHHCVATNLSTSHASNARKPFRHVRSACWSKGTSWEEDMAEFDQENEYWIPNCSNFPVVDSAIVIECTMYAFQITIQEAKKRGFNSKRFRDSFKKSVRRRFSNLNQTVIVYYLVPKGVKFQLPKNEDGFLFKDHLVDMTDETSLSASLYDLFDSLSPS